MLRVVSEFDDIIVAVGAAHEMALRAAHPADMLNCLDRHMECPFHHVLPWLSPRRGE